MPRHDIRQSKAAAPSHLGNPMGHGGGSFRDPLPKAEAGCTDYSFPVAGAPDLTKVSMTVHINMQKTVDK